MIERTMETTQKEFIEIFKKKGYTLAPNYPLLTQDKTLLFVNSTIVPFKDLMQNDELFDKTVHVQDCFRNKMSGEWLYFFKMLGLTGVKKDLSLMFEDIVLFIQDYFEIPLRQIEAVINKDDKELIDLWQEINPNGETILIEGDNEKYKTRWQYGKDYHLIGKGLTLTYNDVNTQKCSPQCNALCTCSKYLPMGNVIVVSNTYSKNQYVDIGFGLEFMHGLNHKGDLFYIDEFRTQVAKIQLLGFGISNSRKIFNLFRSIIVLLEQGCQPSSKKAGYVLRQLIRKYVNVLYEAGGVHEVDKLNDQIYAIFDVNQDTKNSLENEVNKYNHSVKKGIPLAEKLLKKYNNILTLELKAIIKDTFGLPNFIVEQLAHRHNEEEI